MLIELNVVRKQQTLLMSNDISKNMNYHKYSHKGTLLRLTPSWQNTKVYRLAKSVIQPTKTLEEI